MGLAHDPRRFWLPPHLDLLNRKIVRFTAEVDRLRRLELTDDDAEATGPRLMVFMPPRHGKSLLTSTYTPVWVLGAFPEMQIALVSYAGDLAAGFGRKARDVLEAKGFDWYGVQINQDSSAAAKWETTQGGGMRAIGVGGGLTGRGADIGIIDDPLKDAEEAQSAVIRENQWDWYQSTFRTRLMPGGGIILVMTRWHEDDLAGRLLNAAREDPEAEQWDVICLPGIAEELPDYVPGSKRDPLGREDGSALWPAKFNAPTMRRVEKAVGAQWFAAMYQQRPAPAEGLLFKRKYFRRYELVDRDAMTVRVLRDDDNGGEYYQERADLLIVGTADVADSTKKAADWTVVTTWAVTNQGDALVLDVERVKMEGPNQMPFVKRKWAEWDWVMVGVEDKTYGTRLIQDLILEGRAVHRLQADTDKITRALPAALRYEVGKIFHPRAAVWLADFEGELTSFPFATNDDQVDTVSYFARWLPFLRAGRAKQRLEDPAAGVPVTAGLSRSDV